MADHTLGEWGVYHGGDRWSVATRESGGSDEIAGVPLRDVGQNGHAKANADLIAAAPDLLEAAKRAREIIESEWGSVPSELRKAIAKAEGNRE